MKKKLDYYRPMYYDPDTSLTEIVQSESYHVLRQMKNDILSSIKNTYSWTSDLLVKAKTINTSLIAGTLTSIAANIGATYYANKKGWSNETIKWYSYIGESAVNTAIFMPLFVIQEYRTTHSLKQSFKNLGYVGLVSFPLSISVYRLSKNVVTDWLVDQGMPYEGATPLAQLGLVIPFGLTIDGILKIAKYFKNNPASITDNVVNSVRFTKTMSKKKTKKTVGKLKG